MNAYPSRLLQITNHLFKRFSLSCFHSLIPRILWLHSHTAWSIIASRFTTCVVWVANWLLCCSVQTQISDHEMCVRTIFNDTNCCDFFVKPTETTVTFSKHCSQSKLKRYKKLCLTKCMTKCARRKYLKQVYVTKTMHQRTIKIIGHFQ